MLTHMKNHGILAQMWCADIKRPKMTKSKLFIKIAVVLVLCILCFTIALGTSMTYVDKAFYRVHGNSSRSDVQKVLHLFRETRVTSSDIPNGFRKGSYQGYVVFRYDFLGCSLLPIHIVYDQQNMVSQIIPTYE